MKIGVDGTIFISSLTGIGNYGYHLLRAIAKQAPQHEFIILTQQSLCVEFEEVNISIRIDVMSFVDNIYYWKLFGMSGACQRAGVDMFWAVSGVAPLIMPCPVVLTVYDFVYRIEPKTMSLRTRWFRRFMQPWWVARASRVLAITQAVDKEMRSYYSRKADAIVLPATDDSFYRRGDEEISRIRTRYALDARYNLIVGTLEPRKNIHKFLKLYMEFRNSNPSIDLPILALIGGKGWNDANIINMITQGERLGIVKRLGYVSAENLPALYSGAELFFMPSRYEGFGMPILEARKCGCPVICSNVPAMHEAGGTLSFYHPPTDDGIRWALEQIYLHGIKPVSDGGADVDWSWESGASKLLSLINDIDFN